MKIKELITLVKTIYKDLFNEEPIEVKQIDEFIYHLKYKNETIEINKAVGNKYRLIFESLTGTVERFREIFDQGVGFVMYSCDASYFIDLTEKHINDVIAHYYSK